MKRMKLMINAVALLAAVLLVGCAPNIDPTEDVTTEPAMLDDFTEPTTATEADATKPTEGGKSGFLEYGFFNHKRDKKGHYVQYEGSEMHLQLKLHASGNMNAYRGTGVLMFVDGQLQPYKTKDDDTYRYMHTVYPEDDVPMIIDLNFVPVSGKEGDILDIWFTYIFCPEYSYFEDGIIGFVLSSAAPATGTRLKMEATPEEVELPDIMDRVVSWTVSKEPLTSKDTRGWSEEDFQIKCVQSFKVNPDEPMNQRTRNVWNISSDKPLKVRFEVYGNPFVHYGLVFFLDNEPVSMAPEDTMFISVEEGYKTVVEAEIDMTGFDGESSIYAALIPRNHFTTEILTDSILDPSTYYMLYEEDPVLKTP